MSSPSSSSSPAPLSRAWKTVLAVAVVALVVFFVATMTKRFHHADTAWALHGDQHQSIGHYWRYAVDGAIPPGHLLSDYAATYHSSPLWWPVMAGLSAIVGPLTAAKVLGVLAYALFALGAVVVVGRRTLWPLGVLIGMVLIRNPPDSVEQITGGMARSMAPALVYLFLWAFMEGRHRLVLFILVLQAGVYPSIVIPCGICYGLYVVIKGPMRDRLRRCAGMFVAGLLIIVLGLAQNISSPKWWGAPVTYEEAEQMPAWKAGGRFPEVPHRSVDDVWRFNLERPFKELSLILPLPKEQQNFVRQHVLAIFVVGPTVLGLLLAALGALLSRRRRPPTHAAADAIATEAVAADEATIDAASTTTTTTPPPTTTTTMPFPWQILALAGATMCAYVLVRIFSFRLFLPSRQVGFVVPYLVTVWVPLILWYGASRVWPQRRLAPFLFVVVFAVLPPFLLRGHGVNTTPAGYGNHDREAAFFTAIRKLPLDDEIACDLPMCEYMMPLGQHVPYAARNLTHPLRPGYYEETERRLVEMHRLIYATSLAEIEAFVANEKVHWLAYRTSEAETLTKRLYNPASGKVRSIFNAGRGKTRLFAKPPKSALVFKNKTQVVVDLDKMIAALKAAPAVEVAPVDNAVADENDKKDKADKNDDDANADNDADN